MGSHNEMAIPIIPLIVAYPTTKRILTQIFFWGILVLFLLLNNVLETQDNQSEISTNCPLFGTQARAKNLKRLRWRDFSRNI